MYSLFGQWPDYRKPLVSKGSPRESSPMIIDHQSKYDRKAKQISKKKKRREGSNLDVTVKNRRRYHYAKRSLGMGWWGKRRLGSREWRKNFGLLCWQKRVFSPTFLNKNFGRVSLCFFWTFEDGEVVATYWAINKLKSDYYYLFLYITEVTTGKVAS